VKKLLLIILALLVFGKSPGTSIDDLEPVRLVRILEEKGIYTIETDTGAKGKGSGMDSALEDMHNSTPGVVFLDTAEFLLIGKTVVDEPKLRELFRPACRICYVQGQLDLQEAADYLQIHMPDSRIRELILGVSEFQMLTMKEGRGSLEP